MNFCAVSTRRREGFFKLLFRVPIRLTVNIHAHGGLSRTSDNFIMKLYYLNVFKLYRSLYRYNLCIIKCVITHGVLFDRSKTVFLFQQNAETVWFTVVSLHIVHIRFSLPSKRPSRLSIVAVSFRLQKNERQYYTQLY